MSLVIPAARGSSSAAIAKVSAPTKEGQENVAPEEAYLELADPDEGTTAVRQSEEEVVTEQPKKVKKKRLLKQSDVLPTKKLRIDHPTLVFGTGGKTLVGLEQIRPVGSRLPAREQLAFPSVTPSSLESECLLDSSAQMILQICTTVESSSTLGIPPEESEGSDDSVYEPPTLDPSEAKRCYAARWNVTNDSLLDDGFSCHTLVDHVAPPSFFSALHTLDYDQLYTEFNVGAARQVCLGAEVRSCAEHELELKENLRAKYTAHGRLLEEKDLEILKLKSQLAEKEVEAAEVICLRDQVSSLSGEKSALTAKVSALKVTVTQKDHDISLLDSRATCLASTLDDAKVACAEAGNKITSLASERDRLAYEVSYLRAGFQDFKERMETQQEEQAQELYNRIAELEAHGTLGYALGRTVDFGMQEGLEAGYEHGTAGINLFAVDAYNPKVARASYINAVKALEDVDFPLVSLLKSKKDAEIYEVLDCFLLDGLLAGLPEAAYLQPCIKQLSIPIHHVGDKTVVGETSLSFALMNVHARAKGAKKHDAALRQLVMEIVSAPMSSQTWVGEASTSVVSLSVEDYDEEDTDEALGSVVAVPKLETCHF
ncbi:hypothetical protein Tco_1255238 [Tanacetum coccineum]